MGYFISLGYLHPLGVLGAVFEKAHCEAPSSTLLFIVYNTVLELLRLAPVQYTTAPDGKAYFVPVNVGSMWTFECIACD